MSKITGFHQHDISNNLHGPLLRLRGVHQLVEAFARDVAAKMDALESKVSSILHRPLQRSAGTAISSFLGMARAVEANTDSSNPQDISNIIA